MVIDHGGGFSTLYGHMSNIERVGGRVRRRTATTSATSGSTGNSTGPHLHFETRIDGDAANPMRYLP